MMSNVAMASARAASGSSAAPTVSAASFDAPMIKRANMRVDVDSDHTRDRVTSAAV
jgi:hypothetical protein